MERESFPDDQWTADKTACMAICAYWDKDTECRDITLKNNIAAGCPFAGIAAPGHKCGTASSQDTFKNNVAHSVEGSGLVYFPNGND